MQVWASDVGRVEATKGPKGVSCSFVDCFGGLSRLVCGGCHVLEYSLNTAS